MGTTNYKETNDSREYFIDNKGRWWGWRRYSSPDDNISDNRDEIRVRGWSINGIKLLPRRVKVLSKDPMCPGNSVIEAHYHFPDNPYRYTAGKAKMAMFGSVLEERLSHALDADNKPDADKPLETEPDKDGFYWRVVKGSNISRSSVSKLVISTAYPQASIDWDVIAAGLGKTNSLALAQIGFLSIGVGEALLLTAGIPEALVWDEDNSNVPIRYEFMYRAGGWPKVSAQKYWRGLIKQYVMHDTDDPNNPQGRVWMDPDGSTSDSESHYRTVMHDVPVKANAAANKIEPLEHDVQLTYDFSNLYSLLTWK